MLVKWALREILQNWKTSLVFIANLSLGLTGFVTLDAFNISLKSYLENNAKKILSADLEVSARRTLKDEEIEIVRRIVGEPLIESQIYEFFAMVSSGKESRLVLVKAIDKNYPFYGELTLESGALIQYESAKSLIGQKNVWAYPELKYQLNLKPGDFLTLGKLNLLVEDFVAKDSTQTFRTAAIAPKIFVSREWLAQSGLIQFGSTFTHAYLYKLQTDEETEPKKKLLLQELKDPAIQVESPKTAGEDSGKQLQYLSDYLGLVALIAIFLSSLGAAYVYRLFLSQRLKEIAIYRTLGLQSSQAIMVYLIQAGFLGALSLVPTVLTARLFLPFLSYALNKLVPFNLSPGISSGSVAYAFSYAVFISFLVTLPFILRINRLRPSRLFNEEKFSENLTIENPISFFPAFFALWGLSVWQSHSLKVGSLFFFSLCGVLVLFAIMGWILFGLFNETPLKAWYFKYGLKSIARLRMSSVAAFVALALGTVLINILPQIKSSIQAEFYMNPDSKTPSLFMFDIQDEQIKPLEDRLKKDDITLLLKSPMIRARIVKLNGKNYERTIESGDTFKTREEEQETRFRNRGINLSYRDALADSESVVEGVPITGRYNPESNAPGKLSVEVGFKDRLGLKLGDILLFDVQGVELKGEVVNFRKVKWNSFQPNFFVMVEPGFLDDAPKTYIAAVPKIELNLKNQLQNELVKEFPNVSILDVERTIREILRVAEQMSWSLELMAALALLVGYVVLYSIIRNQVLQRRWEINMMKVLGASFGETRAYLLTESLTISFLAVMLGTLVSVLVSYILTRWIFKTNFAIDFFTPLVSSLVIMGLSLIVSLLAAQSILKEKPLIILRENIN